MMARLRPLIRAKVMAHTEGQIDAVWWHRTNPNSDVTTEAVLEAIAAYQAERADIELLRAREPAIEGK